MRNKLLNYLTFVLFFYGCHPSDQKSSHIAEEKPDSIANPSQPQIKSSNQKEPAKQKNSEEWQKRQIDSILISKLGIEQSEIRPNASLTDDLGADSLDVVEIIIAVEAVFKIEISQETAEKIRFVKDLYEVSNKRR